LLLAGRAPHDAEPAQGRGLLELAGQVVEQAGGRDGGLQSQLCDQPVNDRMGEPFDLGVDGSDWLVGELFGGTGEGAHAPINSSATLKAGMMGLESSVTWRGTGKVGATSLALPPVYARCLPEDALTTGGIAVPGIGLPGPSSAYGQRRRAHGEPRGGASPARPWRDTAGGVARAAPGLVRCGLPRHVAALSRSGEIVGSTGNLHQAAWVADWATLLLAEERARRPGWSRRADG